MVVSGESLWWWWLAVVAGGGDWWWWLVVVSDGQWWWSLMVVSRGSLWWWWLVVACDGQWWWLLVVVVNVGGHWVHCWLSVMVVSDGCQWWSVEKITDGRTRLFYSSMHDILKFRHSLWIKLCCTNWVKGFWIIFYLISPRGVGRSRRYCNTGPTRGEVGASPWIFSQFQKSV